MDTLCNPPGLLQESLGPFGPEVSRECPSGCLWGPSGPGLRSVQKVSRECPRSVKKVSRHSGDTLGALFGQRGARGPKRPRDTPSPTDSCSRKRQVLDMFWPIGSVFRSGNPVQCMPGVGGFPVLSIGLHYDLSGGSTALHRDLISHSNGISSSWWKRWRRLLRKWSLVS